MGRIQSNIGLITGMPIGETVASLMEIAARPRELLRERTDRLKEEQAAITELSALLLSVQYITNNLGKVELYDRRAVTSSDPGTLAATLTGSPAKGSYQYTPIRMAQSQHWLSTGLKSRKTRRIPDWACQDCAQESQYCRVAYFLLLS